MHFITTVLTLNKTDNGRVTQYWGAFVNHCCCGKAISITYWSVWVPGRLCMSVRECCLAFPACNAYAPYYDVMCSPRSPPHFSTCHKRCDFIKKLSNIKYVFWFSLQRSSKTFLIPRINQRHIVINVKMSSCNVGFYWNLNFLHRFSKKSPISSQVVLCG